MIGDFMLFSVIIPAYNAEKFIERSYKSVINQSCDDFEIIIINDGSIDSTDNVIKTFNDNRLKYISKKNEGVSVARNVGINIATGEYICFLDADDEYYCNHLEILKNAIFQYPDCEIFATMNSTKLLSGKVISVPEKNDYYVSKDAVIDLLKGKIKVWTGCMCIKKSAFNKYGLFMIGIKHGEDRDMWERIYVHGYLVYIRSITVQRNRDGSELTRLYNRNWSDIDWNLRLKKYLKDKNISQKIKKSLIISNEWHKLSNVRTNLIFGRKKDAYYLYKSIRKEVIPFTRKASTLLSFLVPNYILKVVIIKRNKDYFLSESSTRENII